MTSKGNFKGGLSRRSVLKAGAAVAGAAVGTEAITGFPTIWAQNIKDVVLHHAGPPVTAIPAIAEQATKDLGFTVQMQATENADLLNRFGRSPDGQQVIQCVVSAHRWRNRES